MEVEVPRLVVLKLYNLLLQGYCRIDFSQFLFLLYSQKFTSDIQNAVKEGMKKVGSNDCHDCH